MLYYLFALLILLIFGKWMLKNLILFILWVAMMSVVGISVLMGLLSNSV